MPRQPGRRRTYTDRARAGSCLINGSNLSRRPISKGLVDGYIGPGGKTILPHRAVAKMDFQLVLDMKSAHARDENHVIESANTKVQSFDGAVMSFVKYLYELAK